MVLRKLGVYREGATGTWVAGMGSPEYSSGEDDLGELKRITQRSYK